MVRGVVAVAYQKGKPELEARLKAWEQDAHWQRYIDQLRVYLNSHDVHFDLEEQNSELDAQPWRETEEYALLTPSLSVKFWSQGTKKSLTVIVLYSR